MDGPLEPSHYSRFVSQPGFQPTVTDCLSRLRMVASPSPAQNPTKTALRRQILTARQAMAIASWQAKSLQICEQLQQTALLKRSHTILAYFSTRQEPDLSTLFSLPKTWGFSRCVGQELVWHQWSTESEWPLQKGAFGILEPHPEAPRLQASEIDLILVPAIACDAQGYRLGYGGGFYDRLLSAPEWANIPTIGIVFEFAYLPQLPHDDWDQPLNSVCTETGWFETGKSGKVEPQA